MAKVKGWHRRPLWQEHRPAVKAGARPKAALIFGHGIHDHCERFNHFFEELCGKHNMIVLSMDYRGHGRSTAGRGAAPPSGYFHTWDGVLDDWADFIRFATARVNDSADQPYPVGGGGGGDAIPVFLAGNSFGAMLTLHTLLLRRPEEVMAEDVKPAGVVLLAPFIDVPRPLLLRLQEAFAPLLSALVPGVRLVEAALPEVLSSDPRAVEQYVADPLTVQKKIFIRPGWLMGQASYWLATHKGEFDLPLLAIHGDADRCCSFPHTAAFVEACGSKDKTLVPLEGGAHLIMHGPERQHVTDTLAKWILDRA